MNAQASTPRYVELETFRRSVNRKIWFVVVGLSSVVFVALGLLFVALVRPVPVIVLDTEGRPIVFRDTVTPRVTMTDVRIRYFATQFVRTFVCIDTASVLEDMTAALNMMTPRFRKIVLSEPKEMARRNKYAGPGMNLRSRLTTVDVRIGEYDPVDANQALFVLVIGRMEFRPRFGEDNEEPVVRFYYSELRLRRVPVTEQTIHGLLVDYVHTTFFDSKDLLEAHVLEQQR